MKATGIVRRIDDLGRVVIPKEIRRTMRIREGDPLEIYTDKDGEVIFKKYSPMGELAGFSSQLCETLAKTTGHTVLITDRDTVVCASGPSRKELADKTLSDEIGHFMETRKTYHEAADGKKVPACKNAEGIFASTAVPVIVEGDVTGCVLFVASEGEQTGETELKLAQTVAGFLGRHMES